jgi:plastocyanin
MLLAAASACSGGYSSPSGPTPPSPSPTPSGPTSVVSIPTGAQALTNTAFSPDLADVTVGTTITWTNTDSVPHTSTADEAGWNSGTVEPGKSFSFTFGTAGTFRYHCAIHPGMIGTVVVR